MQSAFVDIGLERDAFLYVSDFFEDNEEYDKIVSGVEEKVLKLEKSPAASAATVHVPTPIEPEMAAILGAVPGAIVGSPMPLPETQLATAPNGEPRRDSNRDANRDASRDANRDGRNDRGGRGRRGRRRRPGGGGLPDSKFFSPREGSRESKRDSGPSERPTERPAEHPASASLDIQAEPAGGLVVLPGESISKYVGQPAAESTPSELAANVVREEHNESAIDQAETDFRRRH
jgi:ribonuclease G